MREFSRPASLYAPLLSWFWNRGVSKETLRRQLRSMHEAGFGGVIFHGSTRHSADEQVRLMRAGIDECKRLGLRAWLSDDGSPLTLDGHPLTQARPDLKAHFLKFHTEDISREMARQWHMPPIAGELLCLLAAPLTGPRRRPEWNSAVSLTTAPAETHVALLSSLNTDARIYLFFQEVAVEHQSSIDLMNPDAVKLLIQGIYEPFYAALGDEFGATVAGICGAEASLWGGGANGELQQFPWSPLLAPAFAAEHGYDLIERLPSLIADTGADAARVRHDYWKTVARLAREGYWQPLRNQATAHGHISSATVLHESSLSRSVAHQGDAVSSLRTLQWPGVAVPCGQNGGLHARLCASIAALRGNAPGSDAPRALAQVWTDCSPATTLHDRMASLHHLLHQGVNCFVAGATHSSLHVQGIGDSLLSELHQPYSAQWKPFAEYIARCSHALSQGRAGARVGLLWPARSGWSHYNPRGHRFVRWVEEDLLATAQLLDELHFDFLLLPEDDLTAAQCEPGSEVQNSEPEDTGLEPQTPDTKPSLLLCGPARLPLEMIVLPSVTALSWAAWRKLEEFVAAGGKVVCLGLLPRWSERGRDEELEQYLSKTTIITVADLYEAYTASESTTSGENAEDAPSAIGYPVVRGHRSGGRLGCYQPRLNPDADDARLRVRQLLMESMTPELETQSPHVLYTRRICFSDDPSRGDANGDLYFIFNADDQPQRVNLRLRPSQTGSPHSLNAWTGAKTPLPEWMPMSEEEGSGLSLTLDMAAHEARCIWIEHGPHGPHCERTNFALESFDGIVARGFATTTGTPLIAVRENDRLVWEGGTSVTIPPPLLLSDEWSAERLGPNVAILEDWQWQRGRHAPGSPRPIGRHTWQSLPRSIPADGLEPSGDTLHRGAFEAADIATFRTVFEVEDAPGSLFLQLDLPDVPVEVYLNDLLLHPGTVPFPNDPLWGNTGWQWFDLSAAQLGTNTLTAIIDYSVASPDVPSREVTRNNSEWLPAVPRLVGEFSLTEDNAITATQFLLFGEGSWHEQGLPFYSGAVDYSQHIEVPGEWKNCRIFLELSRMRDVVEAHINGNPMGVRVTTPYRFEVTAGLQPGTSCEVRLRIWNTAEAALHDNAGEPSPSGVLGPVRLVAYPAIEIRRSHDDN